MFFSNTNVKESCPHHKQRFLPAFGKKLRRCTIICIIQRHVPLDMPHMEPAAQVDGGVPVMGVFLLTTGPAALGRAQHASVLRLRPVERGGQKQQAASLFLYFSSPTPTPAADGGTAGRRDGARRAGAQGRARERARVVGLLVHTPTRTCGVGRSVWEYVTFGP